MDIPTFPVGLIIGLLPVLVDLEGHTGPARLLLDGKPVCEVTARMPACLVDLGEEPRIHSLDLERLDPQGFVVESVRRWVNRPSPRAEIRAIGSCDEKKRDCSFQFRWAHPAKLDPSKITVSLDGQKPHDANPSGIRIPFPRSQPPTVLTVDAVFPGGERATSARLLHASYPQQTEAQLTALSIELEPGETDDRLAARFRESGWKLRVIEKGDAEIVFVIEPQALQGLRVGYREAPLFTRYGQGGDTGFYAPLLEGIESLRFLVADESLSLAQLTGGSRSRSRWIADAIGVSSHASTARVRVADSVAIAGYHLGGGPRRRALVLILARSETEALHPDASTFAPAQAQEYLREVMVPLAVWRVGGAGDLDWPEGERLEKGDDLARAGARLRHSLDSQRVVWVEGPAGQGADLPDLPAAVSYAGRGKPAPPASPAEKAATLRVAARPSPIVYALAANPGSSETLYAGTREGLFASSDSGATWKRAPTGHDSPVFALAFGAENRSEMLVGTSGSLLRGISGGESWSSFPAAATLALAVDPAEPTTIYAGMRGRILKSTDGGLGWSGSSTGISKSFALALAVDPKERTVVYAATAGDGVFKSADAGQSWKPLGRELDKTTVRCLAIDPTVSGTLYAGTDGGVFASTNGGRSWKSASIGLPRSVVYALALDPNDPARIAAGTAKGLFFSTDRGKTWKPSTEKGAAAPITALLYDRRGKLFAGTLGDGVLAFGPP